MLDHDRVVSGVTSWRFKPPRMIVPVLHPFRQTSAYGLVLFLRRLKRTFRVHRSRSRREADLPRTPVKVPQRNGPSAYTNGPSTYANRPFAYGLSRALFAYRVSPSGERRDKFPSCGPSAYSTTLTQVNIHRKADRTGLLVGPSEYTERPFRVRRTGPTAYEPKTLRVFPPDLSRTPYKEARETSVLETKLEKSGVGLRPDDEKSNAPKKTGEMGNKKVVSATREVTILGAL